MTCFDLECEVNQKQFDKMTMEPTKKSGSSFVEKAQHLAPLNCGSQVGGASAGVTGTADAAGRPGSGCDADVCSTSPGGIDCNARDDLDSVTPLEKVQENQTNCSPHSTFKLGADSVDLEDAPVFEPFVVNTSGNGFLSPTSPTSPTSPGSGNEVDGEGRPRKSSMRDSNRPKSPPGTPCRKSVRFADALGLDLETVKTILRTESPPDLPRLNVYVDEEKQTISAKALSLCFQQPGGQANFLRRLYDQTVCLENVVVHEVTLIGTIKVRNLGFEKDVRIRHSSDNWNTYIDSMAMYVAGSCDGPTDRFSFGLSGPRSMTPGNILSFAIYYKVNGKIYWDNNGGQNYALVCEEVKKG